MSVWLNALLITGSGATIYLCITVYTYEIIPWAHNPIMLREIIPILNIYTYMDFPKSGIFFPTLRFRAKILQNSQRE